MPFFKRLRHLFLHTPLAWRFVALEHSSIQQVWQFLLGPLVVVSVVLAVLGWGVAQSGGVGHDMGWLGAVAAALLLAGLLALGIWLLGRMGYVLAASFSKDGRASRRRGFQLMAHSAVPMLLCTFVAFVPGAVWLSAIGFAWMLWLLWQGITPLMGVHPAKRAVYFWTMAGGCLLWALLTVGLMFSVLPKRMAWEHGAGAGGNLSPALPASAAASAARHTASVASAPAVDLAASGADAGGDANASPEPALNDETAQLEPLDASMVALSSKLANGLPKTLVNLPRESLGEQTIVMDGALGVVVNAAYAQAEREIALNVIYVGPDPKTEVPGTWANASVARDTEERTEKVYAEGLRHISETAWKDGSAASLKVMLANGLMLDLDARGMSMDQLKAALKELKVDELEQIDI